MACTSEETLAGHAAGKKHRSKARGARARAAGETVGDAAPVVESAREAETVVKQVKGNTIDVKKKFAFNGDKPKGNSI